MYLFYKDKDIALIILDIAMYYPFFKAHEKQCVRLEAMEETEE